MQVVNVDCIVINKEDDSYENVNISDGYHEYKYGTRDGRAGS